MGAGSCLGEGTIAQDGALGPGRRSLSLQGQSRQESSLRKAYLLSFLYVLSNSLTEFAFHQAVLTEYVIPSEERNLESMFQQVQ